jgi:hypothetical protein
VVASLARRLLMLKTVEGIYRHGKVELIEAPEDVRDPTPVVVTFLEKPRPDGRL